MIATRLSSVWQVAGIAVAALCCYLVSQSVASERAGLAKVDRQIAAEQDGLTKLATEIATRSRLTQIESWNHQLALQAPRAGQYMATGVQLASLYARDPHPPLPLDPGVAPRQGAVQVVAYRAPVPAPVPSVASAAAVSLKPAPEPLLRTATYVRPNPNRLDGAAMPLERVAFRATGTLLSSDIASLARAEQARHKPSGTPE